MNECTTIDKPFCMYDADQHIDHDRYSTNLTTITCVFCSLVQTKAFHTIQYVYVQQSAYSDQYVGNQGTGLHAL